MIINSYLQEKLKEYGVENIKRFTILYESVTNEMLKKIFAIIHSELNDLFKYLNGRLNSGHYTAHESRRLIYWIEQIEELQDNLIETGMAFETNKYYESIINKCNNFLQSSGGSPIPTGFNKINLVQTEPIFTIKQTIVVEKGNKNAVYPIKLIGEGSYADVFKYKDEFYDKYFVIKRAKNNLTKKEYERFKKEFGEMKKLSSPYVVEVYRFDKEKREYIMEHVDETIKQYIEKNNNKLSKGDRKNIVNQILRAFQYIHSQGLLHRDISLTNILVKKYEGLSIVKISDFGLVKTRESTLTSLDSEIKGSLNDPQLEVFGFKNYVIGHEIYALTRLIFFVMTGRTRIENIDTIALEEFITKGINADINQRYRDVNELRMAFRKV